MPTSEQDSGVREALQEAGVNPAAFFDVLSDSHRRVVVERLDEHGPQTLPELADELVRWTSDEQEDEIPDEQSESYYVALYHVHVPKLVDAGIAEYDEDDDTVSLVDECDGISGDVALSVPE